MGRIEYIIVGLTYGNILNLTHKNKGDKVRVRGEKDFIKRKRRIKLQASSSSSYLSGNSVKTLDAACLISGT